MSCIMMIARPVCGFRLLMCFRLHVLPSPCAHRYISPSSSPSQSLPSFLFPLSADGKSLISTVSSLSVLAVLSIRAPCSPTESFSKNYGAPRLVEASAKYARLRLYSASILQISRNSNLSLTPCPHWHRQTGPISCTRP